MLKKYTRIAAVFMLAFAFLANFHAQNLDTTTQNKKWLEMMQDPSLKFSEVQKVFNNYWQNRTDYKSNGYKVFKRWEYINENRVLADGRLQQPGYVWEVYNKYQTEQSTKRKIAQRSAAGTWAQMGPNAYPTNNTGQPTGMGRVNSLAFHPTDANTIYAGAASGGLWKSTNLGGSWSSISSNLPKLGVSAIVVHPSNADTIYIGTGDRDASDAPGIGVFRTVNGGVSWEQLSTGNNGMGNVTVGALLMDPTNSNILIAATSAGIYRTTDAGKNWSLRISGDFRDLKFNTGNTSIVYGTRIVTPAEFYRSADNGINWTKITSGVPTSGIGSRMVVGVSAANSNYVYLVQINSTNANFAGLLKSTDAGLTFTTQSTSPNIFDYACNGSGAASQAFYDLCIAVDPTDADKVFVGSVNNWKSTNGGVSWTIVSHWVGSNFSSSSSANCAVSVHADQHCYEWSPHNGNLFVGNDGGVYKTANLGTTWTEISNNLSISQIYKIGINANNVNQVLGGLQDNGCFAITTGTNFLTIAGGDGMECLIDNTNANYCFTTSTVGQVRRSITGITGSYSMISGSGVNGITESGAWVAPYFLHKTNPNTMFEGFKNVWRTTNVRASSASAIVWEQISTGETNNCNVLEQSGVNPNIMYVVRSSGIKQTSNANATASQVTWKSCPLPGGFVPSDLKTHPTDSNIVYAAAGNGVYKSTDKGQSWTNISNNLPALFTNCLIIDKNASEGIYVGNQTGVWYKNSTITDWILFSADLPPVDVRELEIYYDVNPSNNRIFAATYGRGIWKSDLAEINVINPTSFAAKPVSNSQIDLSWVKNAANNNVMIAVATTDIFGTPVSGTAYSSGNTLAGGGTIIYNGGATTFANIALNTGTKYFYKIWSVNSSNQYSAGLPIVWATTFSSVWTAGAGTTNWFTPANWGSNKVPTNTDGVYIPASAPFQPNISASGAVCNDITIETGASLTMNSSTAYTLQVAGNFTNNGTFNRGIGNVDFNSINPLQVVTGNSTTNFNAITINKGSIDNVLQVTSVITLNATSNPLTLNSGTFKLSSNSTITPYTSAPTIGTNACFWNDGGTVNISAFGLFVNSGTLRNTAGAITIGNAVGHSITYLNSGKLILEGGTINLAGRFSPNSGASSGTLQVSGGNFNVNLLGSTSTTRAALEINPGARFYFSGGTIALQRNCSNVTADVMLGATDNSVTGGVFQIGTSSSPVASSFKINAAHNLFTVTLNATAAPNVQLITNGLTVNGNLNIEAGQLTTNNFPFSVKGNLTNNGTLTAGISNVIFNGSSSQNVSGSSVTSLKLFTLNNSNGISLLGGAELKVDSLFTATAGSITTNTGRITFADNSNYVGMGSNKFINGNCRKVGNDAFTFPIGSGSVYAPISISAPALNTDHFTASYTNACPHPTYDTTSHSTAITNINANEFWVLNRTGGSSNVAVTLSWDTRSGPIVNLPNLLVARWNGTQWVSEGNAGTTGNSTAGTIVSNTVTNFSPFTLANTGAVPLNFQKIKLNAYKRINAAEIAIQFASNSTGSYNLVIEKSNDGLNWKELQSWNKVLQDGETETKKTMDLQPHSGKNYYRIRVTDLNTNKVVSSTQILDFNVKSNVNFITPNPATNVLNIQTNSSDFSIQLFDFSGKEILNVNNTKRIAIDAIKSGMYIAKITESDGNSNTQLLLIAKD